MIELPREGYKTITVKEKVYDDLADFAERTHRSVPQSIEYLIAYCRDLMTAELVPVQEVTA